MFLIYKVLNVNAVRGVQENVFELYRAYSEDIFL